MGGYIHRMGELRKVETKEGGLGNETFRKDLHSKEVEEVIGKGHFRWLGHIQKICEESQKKYKKRLNKKLNIYGRTSQEFSGSSNIRETS